VLSSGSLAVSATIVFSETMSANLTSQVKLISNTWSASVKPVIVLGTKFLKASGLDVLLPLLNIIN
jgi:hypothetical protein